MEQARVVRAKGEIWLTCLCGKKIAKITPNTIIKEVYTKCPYCRRELELDTKEAENEKATYC